LFQGIVIGLDYYISYMSKYLGYDSDSTDLYELINEICIEAIEENDIEKWEVEDALSYCESNIQEY